jgi:hypothetical protein
MRILNKAPEDCLMDRGRFSVICEARNSRFLLPPAFGKTITRIMSRIMPLSAALFLCAACVSSAPETTSGWGSERPPARTDAAGTTAGEKATTPGQTQPQEANPASEQTTPEQATPSAGWTHAGQGYRRSCAPPIPENEGLLHKIIRILSGPDWCGPDPDVDTNISAGGAAGG